MLDANLLLKMAHCSNLSLAHVSRILEFLKQLFSQALAAHRRSHLLQLSVAHASQSRAVDAGLLYARPASLQLRTQSSSLRSKYAEHTTQCDRVMHRERTMSCGVLCQCGGEGSVRARCSSSCRFAVKLSARASLRMSVSAVISYMSNS